MLNSQINAKTGTLVIDLANISPNGLGELLRAHVYGLDKGYRDAVVTGPYTEIPEENISEDIVNEVLPNLEDREDWMKVTAWSDEILTVATNNDGDTTMLFQIKLPNGTRTIINYEANRDYGWEEIEG